MRPSQSIFRNRRSYNKWVGNQTLEDFALRFTATRARRWSIEHIAGTALGATAFMALEAIAGAVTLQYGFTNTLWAIATVSIVILITGLPICYNAARHGLDIDLLTRSAGFGYLGSTITSLIYASFTFIFFAIEAAILASALHAMLGIPLVIGYVICAAAVVPIVTHGITAISKFQIGTQGFWLALQLIALGIAFSYEIEHVPDWLYFEPLSRAGNTGFDLALFGAAASIMFAMVAQIGEQVDYLRFLPVKTSENRQRWWFWLLLAGPGWILIGIIKMLLGSFLAYLALTAGSDPVHAADPVYMYQRAFDLALQSPVISLYLAGVMVVISQMKINVTNAYAGSIAWSNFFSRLTHSHPGRVVWLVFNVVIALLLMELGIYRVLESILGVFAIVALSWLGSLSADLMINKPLGLSPDVAEFKRAHLYDVNPVGAGSMLIASVTGILCYLGHFGETVAHLAHFISLALCYLLVPLIAVISRGRFYLARQSPELEHVATVEEDIYRCCICETPFEKPDMSYCPAYQGIICSLCCSLDARCLDSCKPDARIGHQARQFFSAFLPTSVINRLDSRIGRFAGIFFVINMIMAALLSLIYTHLASADPAQNNVLGQALWALFFTLMIVTGVIAWLYLLARESREAAQQESNRQTQRLIAEIEAHKLTDQLLQDAKNLAERANNAKSRYISGISHELRTPLQSILGYAQLLAQREQMDSDSLRGLNIIRRNGEYLTDLIEGLLDISKIEAGRLDILRNRVQFRDFLECIVEIFQRQAESKGIAFRFVTRSYLPDYVVCDSKRVRQILSNLLSNAVKYTNQGTIVFSVGYRNQVADFTVTDTGVGIDDCDMERILNPFERVRNDRVPNVSGAGLGLTIVRLLIEIMGGDLQIESTSGKGSTFRVSLFMSSDTESRKSMPCDLPITGYSGQRRTLMIVDDEPVNRGLLSDLLNPLGFITLEAKDGDACIQMTHGNAVDCYLLDICMPGINGLQLAHHLRMHGITVPIIMISADPRELHENSNGHDYDDYLVKPISNRMLLNTIGRLLDIEWQYETLADTGSPRSMPGSMITAPMKSFSALRNDSLVTELTEHAGNGYYKGVKDTLSHARRTGTFTSEQLNLIDDMVDNFQLEKLLRLLQTEPHNEH